MDENRILIVDDEESIRNLCKRTLKKDNYFLMQALNGDEALEILNKNKFDFDLIISDLMMPGNTDGKKLLHEVKNNYAHTDVIIMTAHPTTETAVLAVKEGAYDYLIKPFSPDDLNSVVERCFEKRHLKSKLDKAYKELKALNDSREMFMQLLVHDMKNPLSGIIGNTQILLMDKREEEEIETLQDILRSSERLHKMILDLLDIGRLEQGILVPLYQTVPLNQIFNEIIALMKGQFEHKKIRIISDVKPAELAFPADHELMLRVLQNFLDNSLRYTQDGGLVELYAEAGADDSMTIRIKDSGQPIPKEFKDTILTRYGRMNTPGERTNRGLGLYFCKLAIEAHGGAIEIEDVQKGCSFIVKIPNKINRKSLMNHAQ